jgi:hypothetical protein
MIWMLAGAGWLILSAVGAVIIGRSIKRADDEEGTNRFDFFDMPEFEFIGDKESAA